MMADINTCLGYWWDTDAGREFDCGYENGAVDCDDCIFNGHNGKKDPRVYQESEDEEK